MRTLQTKPVLTPTQRYLFRYMRRTLRRRGIHLDREAHARNEVVYVLSGRARVVGKRPWAASNARG